MISFNHFNISLLCIILLGGPANCPHFIKHFPYGTITLNRKCVTRPQKTAQVQPKEHDKCLGRPLGLKMPQIRLSNIGHARKSNTCFVSIRCSLHFKQCFGTFYGLGPRDFQWHIMTFTWRHSSICGFNVTTYTATVLAVTLSNCLWRKQI